MDHILVDVVLVGVDVDWWTLTTSLVPGLIRCVMGSGRMIIVLATSEMQLVCKSVYCYTVDTL